MPESSKTYGIIAEFLTPADAMHAAEKVRDSGFRKRLVIAQLEVFVTRLRVLQDGDPQALSRVHQNRRHIGEIKSRDVRSLKMRPLRRIGTPELFEV